MTRIVLYFFLILLHTLFMSGQQLRTITIDAETARPLNLSEIAEKVTPVILETPTTVVNGNIFMTSEYLFITSLSTVVQYDLTGKFIRTIDCGGYIDFNVTVDTLKKELYVAVKNKIKCYDYSGNLKKEYPYKNSSLYILYDKGQIWSLTYNKKSEKEVTQSISKINLSTGETILIFSFESTDYGNGCITRYNGNPVCSFEYDNKLYLVRQNNAPPIVQWNINPPPQAKKDRVTLRTNGFAGDYLFINYRRGDQFYTYLENMKTGEKYNTNIVVDDVFNTKTNCRLYSLNQNGYFFFVKDLSDINGNHIGNIPLKKGPVIFIVKTK